MSEKKINLEEIIQECVGIRPDAKNTTPMDYGECKFVMLEFGKQLLQLAADNAIKVDFVEHDFNKSVYSQILNTIDQVR